MSGPTNSTIALQQLAESLASENSAALRGSLSLTSTSILLIWDIIITYDQEIELIWRAQNCIVNYLFFIIRYGAVSQIIISLVLVLDNINTSHNICRLYAWYYSLSTAALLCSVDLLLVYRAVAFYARDKRILVTLGICWLINSGALLVVGTLDAISFPVTHSTILSVYGISEECLESKFPRLLNYFWISETIFQSILFLLISIRFVRQSIISLIRTEGITTVYFVFIRDGVWAYCLLFGLFIASVTLNKLVDLSVSFWAVNFTMITATRLILNLRGLNSSYAISEAYSISLPKWAGGRVRVDTISESDASDTTLSQANEVELQNMGTS